MAITPDAIKDRQLSSEEEQQVEEMEALMDRFLQMNFVPEGVVCYIPPVELSIGVARELLTRYRNVGWFVSASGEMPNFYFMKNRETSFSDIVSLLKGAPLQ